MVIEREVLRIERHSAFAIGTAFFYYHPECYEEPGITPVEITALPHNEVGSTATCCMCGESIHQDCGNDSDELPPQELIDWLDHVREVGIAPGTTPPVKSYFIMGYRANGTSRQFRCLDAAQAEDNALMLWNTGNWTRIAINDEARYGA